eukprot:4061898-Pleurochrysis_carterae.AAC.2
MASLRKPNPRAVGATKLKTTCTTRRGSTRLQALFNKYGVFSLLVLKASQKQTLRCNPRPEVQKTATKLKGPNDLAVQNVVTTNRANINRIVFKQTTEIVVRRGWVLTHVRSMRACVFMCERERANVSVRACAYSKPCERTYACASVCESVCACPRTLLTCSRA